MFYEKLKTIEAFIGSSLLVGVILQYMFSAHRGMRILVLIVLTTFLLAFGILWPLMDWLNTLEILGQSGRVPSDSPLRIVVLSLTSLMSQDLIALIVKFLPDFLQSRIKKGLGVSVDD